MNAKELLNDIRKLTIECSDDSRVGIKKADNIVEIVKTLSGSLRELSLYEELASINATDQQMKLFIQNLPEIEQMKDLWQRLAAHVEMSRL